MASALWGWLLPHTGLFLTTTEASGGDYDHTPVPQEVAGGRLSPSPGHREALRLAPLASPPWTAGSPQLPAGNQTALLPKGHNVKVILILSHFSGR